MALSNFGDRDPCPPAAVSGDLLIAVASWTEKVWTSPHLMSFLKILSAGGFWATLPAK